MYRVKETFPTLQGEGAQAGRSAVFLRFAGCNLWSGAEWSRSGAICRFCDTDFVGTDGKGGGTFATAFELAQHVASQWPARSDKGCRYVVCTGGEPLLQLDATAVEALHAHDFHVAVETNGTVPQPPGIDWLTVSPKAGAKLALAAGDELKLVYPQQGTQPEKYQDLPFNHFFLQPMDGPMRAEHTAAAIDFCQRNPRWRLSIQTHKYIGMP